MILADLSPLANHLWQSTLSAALAWLLTLALRKNRAAVRYWIWLAASVKFLIPFSLLVSAGGHFAWRGAPAIRQPQLSVVMDEVSRPFALPGLGPRRVGASGAPGELLETLLFGVWFCGLSIGVVAWSRWWWQIRAVRLTATPLDLNLPIQVMSSAARLEPGVFGIRKPVLLLPEGITDRLTPAQLEAVLAHELCHVQRRDNLTGAIHMAVEAVFWFHPVVWWIGSRLVEERERACDEEVLRASNDPETYAEGILNVCKFYLESPLVCVSGVTGADLRKRIEAIVSCHPAHRLSFTRKLLLAAAGTIAVAGPIVIGLTDSARLRAQSQPATSPAFEVASVKLNKSGTRGGRINTEAGRLTITNIPLVTCILAAYELQRYQFSGEPGWVGTERYDIVAKADTPVGDHQLMLMLQGLLAERFKLASHHATKELPGYALVVGKNGPKLHEVEVAGKGWVRNNPGGMTGQEVSMRELALSLSARLGLPVVDLTGIKGVYELKLEWTPDASQSKNLAEAKDNPLVEFTGDPNGPSIFTALQEQMGLKLEPRKVPTETVVVDHIERPSEN
jgi:bla regulator protein BlaR1